MPSRSGGCLHRVHCVYDRGHSGQRSTASVPSGRLVWPQCSIGSDRICPGITTVDECKIGIMPGFIQKPGVVGAISCSGSLTYEVVHQLSTLVLANDLYRIGRRPREWHELCRCAAVVRTRSGNPSHVMIGEIGGDAEERAAEFIADNIKKPVISSFAGITAPPGVEWAIPVPLLAVGRDGERKDEGTRVRWGSCRQKSGGNRKRRQARAGTLISGGGEEGRGGGFGIRRGPVLAANGSSRLFPILCSP